MDQLDRSGKIVAGEALYWQTSIVATIFAEGGGYVFPVKDNQKNLRETIATACDAPVFPLVSFAGDLDKAQGRLERRGIARLPAHAAGIADDGPSVRHVCRVTRVRPGQENGEAGAGGGRLSDRPVARRAHVFCSVAKDRTGRGNTLDRHTEDLIGDAKLAHILENNESSTGAKIWALPMLGMLNFLLRSSK